MYVIARKLWSPKRATADICAGLILPAPRHIRDMALGSMDRPVSTYKNLSLALTLLTRQKDVEWHWLHWDRNFLSPTVTT